MGSQRSRVVFRVWRGAAVAVLLVLLLALALVPVASAARSGRVGPEALSRPGAPLKATGELAQAAWVMYGIWDAQPAGTLTYEMTETAPEMTLTATDGTGTPVWSVQAGDVWAASGTLPAALIAEFTDPDPNELRDGTLRAYDADGTVRFEKAFSNRFVQPLCITARRLVWVEVSASRVTRVFVRQGSTTRSLTLPYRAPYPEPGVPRRVVRQRAAAGRRRLHGVPGQVADEDLLAAREQQRCPQHRVVQGDRLGLHRAQPDGLHAAVISDRIPYATSRCLWVEFGKFGGKLLPGDALAVGQMDVGKYRIFQQGGYSFASETLGWSTSSVAVIDWTWWGTLYQRAWVWHRETGWIWFRHDPDIVCLAGVDDVGALTVINADTWGIVSVPGTYAEAVPLADGRLALMSATGELSFIANPVAGP